MFGGGSGGGGGGSANGGNSGGGGRGDSGGGGGDSGGGGGGGAGPGRSVQRHEFVAIGGRSLSLRFFPLEGRSGLRLFSFGFLSLDFRSALNSRE